MAAGATALAAAPAVDAAADPAPDARADDPTRLAYRETDHIRQAYARMRF